MIPTSCKSSAFHVGDLLAPYLVVSDLGHINLGSGWGWAACRVGLRVCVGMRVRMASLVSSQVRSAYAKNGHSVKKICIFEQFLNDFGRETRL